MFVFVRESFELELARILENSPTFPTLFAFRELYICLIADIRSSAEKCEASLVFFSGLEVREKSGASLRWVIYENLLSFALILSE